MRSTWEMWSGKTAFLGDIYVLVGEKKQTLSHSLWYTTDSGGLLNLIARILLG